MKKIIILLILVLLLSGCIAADVDRTYTHQSDPKKIPIYNQTLILRTDGTYFLSTIETHYFNYTVKDSTSGTYTETDRSIILSQTFGSSILTKNGSVLVDEDGDIWKPK